MTEQPFWWQPQPQRSQAPKEESEQVACGQSCLREGEGPQGSDSDGEHLSGVQGDVGWGNHVPTAVPGGGALRGDFSWPAPQTAAPC